MYLLTYMRVFGFEFVKEGGPNEKAVKRQLWRFLDKFSDEFECLNLLHFWGTGYINKIKND